MGTTSETALIEYADRGLDAEIANRMVHGLQRLPLPFQPRDPIALATIVGEIAGWPGHEHSIDPHAANQRDRAIDEHLDTFLNASRILQRAIPGSDFVAAFMAIMEPRISAANSPTDADQECLRVAQFLEGGAPTLDLGSRPTLTGAPTKDIYAQQIIRFVFWYLQKFENEVIDVRTDKTGQYPTSKCSAISQVALEASFIEPNSKIASMLKNVMKKPELYRLELDKWDFLPSSRHPAADIMYPPRKR
jgi:hypothetical protein